MTSGMVGGLAIVWIGFIIALALNIAGVRRFVPGTRQGSRHARWAVIVYAIVGFGILIALAPSPQRANVQSDGQATPTVVATVETAAPEATPTLTATPTVTAAATPTAIPRPTAEILSHSSYRSGSGDYLYIVGEVRNNSNKALNYVEILATFYDENGKVVDTDYAYVAGGDPVQPGSTAPFKLMTNWRPFHHYALQVSLRQ